MGLVLVDFECVRCRKITRAKVISQWVEGVINALFTDCGCVYVAMDDRKLPGALIVAGEEDADEGKDKSR